MNIVTDEKVLRKECKSISNQEDFNEVIKVANEMVKTMFDSQGVGIAAPQIGINKRFFFAILDGNRVELFVNPVITNKSEEIEEDSEGCLSVPDYFGTVTRYKNITVKYFNGRENKEETFEGFNARVVQHEYDHLDGILYTDKATNVTKKELLSI